jgi:hypothetical protein
LFLNSHIYIQTRKWKHFNATFARGHALQCPGVAVGGKGSCWSLL